LPRALDACVLHPQLRRDEKLFARNAGLGNASSHCLLVEIGRRRVDQAVAGLDCVDDGSLAFLRVGNLEDAVARDGHLDAVVERD
jgi:hypothetical protein